MILMSTKTSGGAQGGWRLSGGPTSVSAMTGTEPGPPFFAGFEKWVNTLRQIMGGKLQVQLLLRINTDL